MAAAVERYNGDGKNDALGSDGKPLLVEAWEINHEQDYKRVWDSANQSADYALVYRGRLSPPAEQLIRTFPS